MGTVALCVAMGVIYGGSWKQSQAGLEIYGHHGENVEFIRFSIDIQWIFLGPSSLKGNLSKLSNANVFFVANL